MKGKTKWFALAALVTLLAALPSAAQLSTGSITGTVVDPSGLAVVGVEVTVVSVGTNRAFKATTNEAGAFTIPSLNIGLYRITIQATGFRLAVVENVKVDTGKETSMPPVKLELGQVSETVTVEAGSTTVETTNAEIKNTVDPKQIEALPLVNRSPLGLLAIQAGVNNLGRTSTVINGQRPSLSNMTLDGINIQDNFIRTNSLDFSPNLPLLSQVSEFTVATANAGAESGGGASVVSFTTPSGTNEWHAEGFWYHRNNALAASSWFANAAGRDANGNPVTPKPFLLLNQYGGNAGGPIMKNKLFVYGWYEGFRQRQQTVQQHTVLTDAARTGSFTYATCPTTACSGPVNTVNVLAARSRGTSNFGPYTINPFVTELLSRMPGQSVINNFQAGDSTASQLLNSAGYRFNKGNNRTRDNYGFKLDWNATPKHTLAGTWAWNRDIVDRPDIDTSFNLAPIVANDDVKRLLSTTWRWTPAATFTNELTGGFNLAPATFINTTNFGQDPVFNFNFFTNPNVTFRNQGRDTDTYNLQNNASWTKGKHFLKFGYFSQFLRVLAFNEAGSNPTYTVGIGSANLQGFQAADTVGGTSNPFFPGGISNTALTSASNLLASLVGFVSTGSQSFFRTSPTSGFVPFAANVQPYKFDTHAGYVSDSWRIRPALTFNFGVRWEYLGRLDQTNGVLILPVIQPGDSVLQTVLSNATLDFVGGPTGRPMYNADMNNFAPNVGIAWDVRGNGKTAVRAGYSVHFVNDEALIAIRNAAQGNSGGSVGIGAAASAFANAQIGGTLPTFNAPTSVVVPRLASDNNAQFGGGIPQTIFAVEPNLRTPYVQEWNLGIQHEVGWRTVVDIHYTGNKGTKLLRGIDFNQVQIFGNGFFEDFQRARSNGFLALNTPATAPGCTTSTCGVFRVLFNPNIPGSQPLTVLPTFGINVVTNGTGGGLTTSNVLTEIQTGAVADLAGRYHLTNGWVGAVPIVANRIAGVADILANAGDSTYHAGVVEVRRRFSKGLGIQANYTFSKVLTDLSSGNLGTNNDQARFTPFLDNSNPRGDRARASFDVTHQFKANFVYELPAGKGHRFNMSNPIVQGFLSGWTISSIFNWQSGTPFSILSSRGTLNRNARCISRCGADSNLSASEVQKMIGVFRRDNAVYLIDPSVLNPASGSLGGRGVGNEQLVCDYTSFSGQVFCNPAPGTIGNLQHFAFDGPNLFTWDFSVYKQTAITERLKFEYRAEFFNFLNHPVFATRDQSINSQQFGQFTGVDVAARRIQMTLRLLW